MENIQCNNCDFKGSEDNLILVEFNIEDENETPTATESSDGIVTRLGSEPRERDFLQGCPNCETDSYLMDI